MRSTTTSQIILKFLYSIMFVCERTETTATWHCRREQTERKKEKFFTKFQSYFSATLNQSEKFENIVGAQDTSKFRVVNLMSMNNLLFLRDSFLFGKIKIFLNRKKLTKDTLWQWEREVIDKQNFTKHNICVMFLPVPHLWQTKSYHQRRTEHIWLDSKWQKSFYFVTISVEN